MDGAATGDVGLRSTGEATVLGAETLGTRAPTGADGVAGATATAVGALIEGGDPTLPGVPLGALDAGTRLGDSLGSLLLECGALVLFPATAFALFGAVAGAGAAGVVVTGAHPQLLAAAAVARVQALGGKARPRPPSLISWQVTLKLLLATRRVTVTLGKVISLLDPPHT